MSPNAPFGGYKQSGFGREGGRAGIEEFVRRKSVYLAPTDRRRGRMLGEQPIEVPRKARNEAMIRSAWGRNGSSSRMNIVM